MNAERLADLTAAGAVVPLSSGGRGVKVLLTYEDRLPPSSFRQTCRALQGTFENLAKKHAGVALDMTTLAVSAQCVKGTLLADRFDELVALLGKDRCHVRVRVARQAVGQTRMA